MLVQGQDFKGCLTQSLILEMKLSSDLSWWWLVNNQSCDRRGPLSLVSFCHTLNLSFRDYAVNRQEEFPPTIAPWVSLPFTAFLSIPFTVSGNRKGMPSILLLFLSWFVTSSDAFQLHVQCVLKSLKAKKVFVANFLLEQYSAVVEVSLGLKHFFTWRPFPFHLWTLMRMVIYSYDPESSRCFVCQLMGRL